MSEKSLTKRTEDYAKWYLDVIDAADLAENAPVRGCMVIKPYGYSLWEQIQKVLDEKIKATGAKNAYFPLFIPQSFLTREAQHVEGFAKECAVVTHHRLEKNAEGKLVPAGPLDEPLVVRPTSETIMYDIFSRWIHSYRDLPLMINQWANIVRWELRTRLFLRTMEFLWQEGHTVHATKAEAEEETRKMLDVYKDFVENYLAIPVLSGKKSQSEKFAGADYTLCIEALTQDNRAIQAGTSHLLGQNFAKAFNVKFLDENGKEQYGWQTSWGVSTRIIGTLIMAHSDDQGLVLPPKIAPVQVVICTIQNQKAASSALTQAAQQISQTLNKVGLRVEIDDRELRPGEKFYGWEKKGVPLRLELGAKELAVESVVVARRDTGTKETIKLAALAEHLPQKLEEIQQNIWQKALAYREAHTFNAENYSEFKEILENKGGFVWANWCESAECEAKIKEETKATTRCIPFNTPEAAGKCIYCGKPAKQKIIFAKAY